MIGALQQAAGLALDPKRTYAERSFGWMSWYLGPIAVAAAIVAAALLVRRLLDRQMHETLAGIALLGPASAIYLWRPNISTDQIWVMRRYLFSALPLLTLLAFGLVAGLWHFVPKGIPRFVTMAAAVAIGAAAVVYPLAAVKPVRNMTEQRGDVDVLRDACGIVGRHAAIVLLPSPTGLLSSWAPQSVRGWCNVPVAIMPGTAAGRPALLAQLATEWSKQGRTLWVLADSSDTIHAVLPSAAVRTTRTAVNPYFLERTLVRRPSHYATEMFSLMLAPVAGS